MIFTTCDHYSDDNHTGLDDDDLCVICLDNTHPPINWKNQTFYYKSCDCNWVVHYECIECYYNYKLVLHSPCYCPICRNFQIYKKGNMPFLLKNYLYGEIIVIIKLAEFVTTLMFYLCLCKSLLGIYLIFIPFHLYKIFE